MKRKTRILSALLSALLISGSISLGVGAVPSGKIIKIDLNGCGKNTCSDCSSLPDGTVIKDGFDINELLRLISSKTRTPSQQDKTSVQQKPSDSQKPQQEASKPDNNAGSSADFSTAYEREVLKLINAERAKYGLSALTVDNNAVNAAHVRAKEIVRSFSHTRPDGSTCFTAAKEAGVSYRTAGENIAYGYQTPEQVVRGWMNSEGHRKNILTSSYTRTGIGCYKSGGTYYWTQFFFG